MANEAAWEQGFAIGSERGRERRAQKQELTDEERQNTYKMYADQLAVLRTKLSMAPKDSKEYQDTFSALENTVGQIKDLYHPQKNPGAIEKFGHLLTDALHITSPQVRQQELSSKLAASQAENKKEADLLASSAPLSPEQQGIAFGKQQTAFKFAQYRSEIEDWINTHPNATEDQKQQASDDIWENTFNFVGSGSLKQVTGTLNGVPTTLLMDTKGRYYTLGRVLVPADEMLGWVPTATTQANKDAAWNQFAKSPEGQEYIKNGGNKYRWLAAQGTIGRTGSQYNFDTKTGEVTDLSNGKRYSIDDMSKTDTPTSVIKMFADARKQMDDKQKNAIALAVARSSAYGAGRFGVFFDPNDPSGTKTVVASYGDAQKEGLHPATGPYAQALSAMLKSSTSGTIGNEIAAFSTALKHAGLLGKAAEDLNNGDNRALNSVKNELATQFSGDPAPTNFNVIAGAYTREITKALAANHITDGEIAENSLSIPQNASPEQIIGAINAYKQLMKSKIDVRQDQVRSIMNYVPYAGASDNNSPSSSNNKGQKPHKIKIGNKYYQYKGTGDTSDLSNYTEISK